eukprot:9346978-Pyramimonas_sp.AAC.1
MVMVMVMVMVMMLMLMLMMMLMMMMMVMILAALAQHLARIERLRRHSSASAAMDGQQHDHITRVQT